MVLSGPIRRRILNSALLSSTSSWKVYEYADITRIPRAQGRPLWGDGLTAEDMEKMPLAEAKLVAVIEFLEWTLDNHRRHPKFVTLGDDRVAQARDSAALRFLIGGTYNKRHASASLITGGRARHRL